MKRRQLLAGGATLAALAGCESYMMPVNQERAPRPEIPSLRSIAFGSCMDQSKPQPIWDAVLAGRPDLCIFGGDNVYHSVPPWTASGLRQAYATQAAVPGFERLRRAVPHMAIWDDNDYGQNDGGASFPHKAESKEEFLSFWNVGPDDPRRQREGLYFARTFGPAGRRVQVIMLDTRWFRSPWKVTDQRDAPGKERYVPDADASKTMLGQAQWRWLEERLSEPADVRLVVSSIQVVADGHGWERWGNFPHEREKLYALIRLTRAQGVVLLSGDRHVGGLYREAGGTAYPLYEMTSSGITHTWREAAEAGPNRLGDLFTDLHYGTVDIDWDARSLQLALRDITGVTRRSQGIAFDALRSA